MLHLNETKPRKPSLDAVLDCATANVDCVSASISMGERGMAECTAASQDCANLCFGFARSLAGDAAIVPSLASAVVDAAERSMKTSMKHAGDHAHCREAAATARACVQACAPFVKEAA